MSFVIPLEVDNALAAALENARTLGNEIGERIGREGVIAGGSAQEIDAMLEAGLEMPRSDSA